MVRRQKKSRETQYASETYLGIQERIATNCRSLRDALDLTQEEAAHRLGLSTRLLIRVEHSESNLTLTTIARICDGYNVDIGDLVRSPTKRRRRR